MANTEPGWIESFRLVMMEHEIVVDGQTLTETKEVSAVIRVKGPAKSDGVEASVGSAGGSAVIEHMKFVHTRIIGERAFQVREVRMGDQVEEVKVNTTMTEDQVYIFRDDWFRLWKPTITDDQAIEQVSHQVDTDEEGKRPDGVIPTEEQLKDLMENLEKVEDYGAMGQTGQPE